LREFLTVSVFFAVFELISLSLLGAEASRPSEIKFPLLGLSEVVLTPNEEELLHSIQKLRQMRETARGIPRTASSSCIKDRLYEEIDQLEAKLLRLCEKDLYTLYRLFQFKLQKFDYLNQDFYELKDIFDNCFDLVLRPTTEDFLEFISEKLNDSDIAVSRIEEFIENPQFFLTRKTKSIFLYQAKVSFLCDDPHATTVVLFPGKYIEVIDSLKKDHPVYPQGMVNEIHQIVQEFNSSKDCKDQHMMLIEHDSDRQTTAGVCGFFAVFSALHADYHPIWNSLFATYGDRVTVPMDAKLMSATGSTNRLFFLESLSDQLEDRERLPEFVSCRIAQRRTLLSPVTTATLAFNSKYSDAFTQLHGDKDLSALYFISNGHSSLDLAQAYLKESLDGRLLNTMITAMELEVHLWRAFKNIKLHVEEE